MAKQNKIFKETEYDDILTPDSFDIVIRCKHCQAIGGFIGVEARYDDIVTIDIVCVNCGHVESCY